MKIYTKTGDRGDTSLYTGQRLAKNDPVFDAIGDVDELNSCLGVVCSILSPDKQFGEIVSQLIMVQHALFDLGAALATPRTRASSSKVDKTRFDHEASGLLEQWIDLMEQQLSPLHSFILPGGHQGGAMLHLARSICRRAERRVVPLNKQADVSDHLLIYLNRLSDYLFVVSRYVNHLAQVPETLWSPHVTLGLARES